MDHGAATIESQTTAHPQPLFPAFTIHTTPFGLDIAIF